MRPNRSNGLHLATAILALSAPASVQAATWSPSTEAVPAAAGGFAGTVTLLDDGRVALSWGDLAQTFLAFAPPGGTFGAPIVTKLTPARWALPANGAIARDGTAVVVYRSRLRFVRARRIIVRPNGLAIRPRSMSTDGHTADGPTVTFAPDGSAIAAWRRYDGTHWQVQIATMAPGRDFSPPHTIDVPDRHAQFVTVAAAPGRDGIVAWTTYRVGRRPAMVTGATPHAHAALIKAGEPGPPIDLGGAASPQIRAATNGTASAVAWTRYRAYEDQSVEISRLTGDEVTHATLVRGPGNTFGPAVSVDREGAVTVAWAKYPTTGTGSTAPVQVATAAAGDAFGAPQQVSAPDVSAVQLALAARDDGAAVLAWQGYVTGAPTGEIRSAVRTRAGEPFGEATLLSPTGQPGHLGSVDIAADGRLAVAFNDVTGTPLGPPSPPIWLARGTTDPAS